MGNKRAKSDPKQPKQQPKTKGLMLFSKARGKHKKLIIIIVSAVLVVGVGVGSFFVFSRFFVKKTTTTNANTSKINGTKLSDTALAVDSKSGYSAGQTYLDRALENASSGSEKASVYLAKAQLTAYSSNNNQSASTKSDAVKYAVAAYKESPTSDTALAVASWSEANGDLKGAIEYYKIYLSKVSKDDESYSGYEGHLKWLERKANL